MEFPGRLYAAFELHRSRPCRYKELDLLGFHGRLLTNVDLPDGFAIGRSVFMEPAGAYLQGRMGEDAAIEAIATHYLSLIDQWKARDRRP